MFSYTEGDNKTRGKLAFLLNSLGVNPKDDKSLVLDLTLIDLSNIDLLFGDELPKGCFQENCEILKEFITNCIAITLDREGLVDSETALKLLDKYGSKLKQDTFEDIVKEFIIKCIAITPLVFTSDREDSVDFGTALELLKKNYHWLSTKNNDLYINIIVQIFKYSDRSRLE